MARKHTLIDRAANFALDAHADQKRKYTGKPYWVHCERVARLARNAGLGADAIAAAFLHDTVEDTDVTLDDINKEFGPRVTALVEMLTDISVPSDGNRKFRKDLDRDHTAKADWVGKSIKLCDLIDNTKSIVRNDPNFAVTYLREKGKLLKVLWFSHPGLFALALFHFVKGKATLAWNRRK